MIQCLWFIFNFVIGVLIGFYVTTLLSPIIGGLGAIVASFLISWIVGELLAIVGDIVRSEYRTHAISHI